MTSQGATLHPSQIGKVAMVISDDRANAVRRAIKVLNPTPIKGNVFIKPNFNSAHPTPGSTHIDTLEALIKHIWEMGASAITIGDRSGMMPTRETMEKKGIFDLAARLGVNVIVLDELDRTQWELRTFPGTFWQRGFAVPLPMLKADSVVSTCCLKTHRYGGHFTISLKNSVGLVASQIPGDTYDYMSELHSSPHQRKMIADINTTYQPHLVVIDAMEAFTKGGPHVGDVVTPGVFLAGSDRIALDAAGVAILRDFGTTPEVSQGSVFAQEQIARAAELGLGVSTPADLELLTDSPEAGAYAARLQQILAGPA
jgi:uncharacterized protein (DUF362 family)